MSSFDILHSLCAIIGQEYKQINVDLPNLPNFCMVRHALVTHQQIMLLALYMH